LAGGQVRGALRLMHLLILRGFELQVQATIEQEDRH
jgi:hypothetical protein